MTIFDIFSSFLFPGDVLCGATMPIPEKEGTRPIPTPDTTSLNASVLAVLPDALFFDPPTVDNSVVSAQRGSPSSLLFAVTDAEGTSGVDPSPHTAVTPDITDCFHRRGQAYRRANVSGAAGATSRMRSLDSVAVMMQSDVVATSAACAESSTMSAPVAQATSTSTTSYLTKAGLAEQMEPLSSSCAGTPPPAPRDGLSLIPMRDLTSATNTASVEENGKTVATGPRPCEEVDGSVHIATRAQRHCGPAMSSPSERPADPNELDCGFELSLESVTLQLSERRYFRMHPVTYLDDCSLHIAPGSMHCIASLNPAYARTALAALAGVDSIAGAQGARLANALPTSSLRYRRHVAYVASLDCCTEEATVYDNLAFATRIRFLVDEQTLRELVEQAASDAFLTDQLHTRASELGPGRRYLLATAMELVAAPTVLLLEDPLSFFSLAELQLFTQLLHSMHRRNPVRTVVWSCSTIPWTLFDCIDGITLLTTGGKTFYTGAKQNVEAFLQKDLGILRVPGEDVMDIMAQTEVDTVAVAHATVSFYNSKYYRELRHELEAHRTRISANAFPSPPEPSRPAPSYASVQSSLLVYTLRRNVLGKAALVPWVGLFVVLMLVIVLVAIANGSPGKNLQNTCGVLFLLLSCSVQINSIFFKSELRDWRTFTSFRNNLYFSVTPYYVATIVRLLAPRLCFALVGSICGAVIFAQTTAVSLSAMMSLLSFTHACLGLFAVYWFPRLELLTWANHIYYAYCVMCSGYLISLSHVPLFFQVVSLLRIAYGGMLSEEISKLLWCKSTAGYDAATSDSQVSSDCFLGKSYLLVMGLENDSFGKSVLGLSLFSLAMMAVLALTMYLSSSLKLFSSS